MRPDLKQPRRGPEAKAFGQAGQYVHRRLDVRPLATADRAMGLQKISVTTEALQLARHGPPLGLLVADKRPHCIDFRSQWRVHDSASP
jgi:hypothetical protein